MPSSDFSPMNDLQRFVEQASARIAALAASQPGNDFERNVRALLDSAVQRLDLVRRQEFDTQRRLLDRALEQVRALEARVAALEAEQH